MIQCSIATWPGAGESTCLESLARENPQLVFRWLEQRPVQFQARRDLAHPLKIQRLDDVGFRAEPLAFLEVAEHLGNGQHDDRDQARPFIRLRSEEHTSELQSPCN